MEAWLRRYGMQFAAIVSVAVVWYTWGALKPLPIVHDESAYVLQAEIFSHLHWTAPSPIIPEFFEQPYVLVVPKVASKYPPGHSLLLALGALLKFAPLVPLLLTGVTAALIVAIMTRLTNPWIALMSWVIWLTTPLTLRFQPGYFSEISTTALILASWWCLLEWRRLHERRWLFLLALALVWCAITRPLTALAFAIPIAVVVVQEARKRKLWRDFAVAALIGVAVLGIIPLWNVRTTGNVLVTPLGEYTRDYYPFDKPGFTPDTTPPRRALSPVQRSLYEDFYAIHQRQRLRDLPRTFIQRLIAIGRDLWGGTHTVLLPFVVAGLVLAGPGRRELRWAAIGPLLLFLFYLTYASDAPWTLYYLEIVPVMSALAAVALWETLLFVAPGVGTLDAERRPMLGSTIIVAVFAVFAFPAVVYWRAQHRQMASLHTAFAAAMAELPSSKSVVFLKYSDRPHHLALVNNFADPAKAPTWVVHDLGERNRELLDAAQDRTAYVFDESNGELKALKR